MHQVSVDGAGTGQGSLASYAVGFVLSLVLTLIPFWVVMHGWLSHAAALIFISGAAMLQILVHLHYFLHLDASSESRWNFLALLLTMLIMVLFVGGTMWIMYHLHYLLA